MRRRGWLVACAGVITLTCLAVAGRDAAAGARDLLIDGVVSTATVRAFTVTACWFGLAAVLLVAVASARRGVRRRQRAGFAVGLALIVGAVTLGIGISVHAGGYRVCCENPTTVQQAEHLVH